MVRFLNPFKADDQVEILRRFTGTGIGEMPPAQRALQISEIRSKAMRKMAKKAIKKGQTVTVADLVNPLKENPKYLEFCKELGLDMPYFEKLAKGVINEENK